MININEILKKRMEYSINGREDLWLDEIVDKSPEEVDVLVPISMFSFRHQLGLYGRLLERYNLRCVVKTKSPFFAVNMWFYIISFTKNDVKKIILSTYNEQPYKRKIGNIRDIVMPDLTNDFINYINDINNAINDGKTNKDNIYIFDYNEFDCSKINPDCYSPSSIKIKNEIKNNKKDFKLMSELALINPEIETKKDIDLIRINNGKIEKYTPITERERHVSKLKEGDIILKRISNKLNFETFFIEKDNSEKYVDIGVFIVIRPLDKTITQYLRFYLSDPKTLYYFMSTSMGNSINHLSSEIVKNIPVLIPTKKMMNESNKLYELKKDQSKYDIEAINEAIRNLNKTNSNDIETKKIVNINIAKALSIIKTEMAYQVINEDLKELDLCYNNKAYKASVILCGSILEAILLDWLSEYEDADSIIDIAKVEREDGRIMDMDLKEIINRLSELIKPYWVEKNKANEIRVTRNYVHPKLYIKNNISLSEEECKKIIDDLKDIISSRLDRK